MTYYELMKLNTFWYQNEIHWFNQSDNFDKKITELFSELLNITSLDISTDCPEIFITVVILYDQLPRHIYRGNKDKIDEYLNLIIPYVQKYYPIFENQLNASELVFALLPFRHTNNFNMIKFVMDEFWSKLKKKI